MRMLLSGIGRREEGVVLRVDGRQSRKIR